MKLKTGLKKSVLLCFMQLLFITVFLSCKKDLDTYYLTEHEKCLGTLYDEGDTLIFLNEDKERFLYLIYKIDSGIAETDFLGVPKYNFEWIRTEFENITNSSFKGHIGIDKQKDFFDYLVKIEFPESYFYFSYRNEEKYSYKTKIIDEYTLDNYIYSNVYVFNNTTIDSADPTQKVYLNKEYGFLKFEDLESGHTYTIVRD